MATTRETIMLLQKQILLNKMLLERTNQNRNYYSNSIIHFKVEIGKLKAASVAREGTICE